MSKIFKAELYKIRHNLVFFVSLLASAPLGALLTVVAGLDSSICLAEVLSSIVSFYEIFFIIMIAMYVTNDYEKGTIKAIVSSGVSKTKIYFGRLLVSIFISEIMFILACIGAYVWGTVKGIPMTSGEFVWTNMQIIESIIIQMIIVIAYAMIGYFISVLTKKQIVAIMVSIVVINFEPVAVSYIGKALGQNLSVLDFSNTISQIEKLNITGNILLSSLLFVLVVFVFTFAIGTYVFKHRDI